MDVSVYPIILISDSGKLSIFLPILIVSSSAPIKMALRSIYCEIDLNYNILFKCKNLATILQVKRKINVLKEDNNNTPLE